MAPSAATAASRTRASSWSVTSRASTATTPGSGGSRSPLAQAATSTIVGVGIAEGPEERRWLVAGPAGAGLDGATPHRGVGIGQRGGEVGRRQRAEPLEGPDGRGPHGGLRVGEGRDGRVEITDVAGHRHLAAPGGGISHGWPHQGSPRLKAHDSTGRWWCWRRALGCPPTHLDEGAVSCPSW